MDNLEGYSYYIRQHALIYGVPIIEKEKLHTVEFDYLIITSFQFYNNIKAEAIEPGVYPIAKHGKDSKYVQMQLIHITCFEKVKQEWDRRKKE